jgi:hypothetical protein
MKKLELNQMENLEGGKGGLVTALLCGTAVLAGSAIAVGTGGIGASIGLAVGAMGCGWSTGHGLETGSWW